MLQTIWNFIVAHQTTHGGGREIPDLDRGTFQFLRQLASFALGRRRFLLDLDLLGTPAPTMRETC